MDGCISVQSFTCFACAHYAKHDMKPVGSNMMINFRCGKSCFYNKTLTLFSLQNQFVLLPTIFFSAKPHIAVSRCQTSDCNNVECCSIYASRSIHAWMVHFIVVVFISKCTVFYNNNTALFRLLMTSWATAAFGLKKDVQQLCIVIVTKKKRTSWTCALFSSNIASFTSTTYCCAPVSFLGLIRFCGWLTV